MKKRAIHTATSYDEFKNFVACATLEPIASKDLDFTNQRAQNPKAKIDIGKCLETIYN